MNIGGNIENSVNIYDVYGEDILSSDVIGLIGVPVDIETEVDFEEATITFYYDKNKLGETDENNLAILWYDEENDWYQILDEDCIIDTEECTVSYVTTHFSTYMLVDKQIWYNTWKQNLSYRSDEVLYDFTYVIDCSGSMSGQRILFAGYAMINFVRAMSENDEASIITFNNSAVLKQTFTDKYTIINKYNNLYNYGLTASGGTNVDNGLKLAINQYKGRQNDKEHVIILICDGDVNYNQLTIDSAVQNNIVIYTINLGYRYSDSYLKKIADETGGEYYFCEHEDEIETMTAIIQNKTIYDVDTTDTDGDGLNDYIDKNPWHAYCGGNNYKKVSSHKKLEYDSDSQSYVCKYCGYKFLAPEAEDENILSSDDFKIMIALNNMLVHYTLGRVAEYGMNSNLCINEKLLINAMNDLRLKYNGKYSYCDNIGNCIVEKCEINNSKAIVYTDVASVTRLNKYFYDGTVINTLGIFFGLADLPQLGYICTLIGVGIDDNISLEDMVSLSTVLTDIYAKKFGDAIAERLSTIASVGIAGYDFFSGKVSIGDTEIRVCLHRGGYGGSAKQSIGTFVIKNNNSICVVDYAEYGYDKYFKPE